MKLVAVFGPVIHSTVSAPPAVGVDLHAEQRYHFSNFIRAVLPPCMVLDTNNSKIMDHRRECCNQCFIQLQKIQKTLPALVR